MHFLKTIPLSQFVFSYPADFRICPSKHKQSHVDDGRIRSHRSKRDLNNFMVPYTKWCGKGWSAKKYSEIGGFSKTGIFYWDERRRKMFDFVTVSDVTKVL